ncbi:hedgehog interacting [Labeo rohita]|uniref:Hedgehog interacting n=1 Tax=Labeo rohita TaxID=84645 RepID=A0A498L351_LABRO|nr:hedgehog interacting [Labeo rohita]
MATSCCQRFTSKECFELKLRGFEEDTMTKFVVWTKDKAFGVDAEVHKPADTRVEKHIEKLALAGARKVSEVRRNVPRDSGIPQKVTSNSSSDISSPPKDTSSPPNDTSIPHKDTSNPPNDTSKTKKIEKCGSLLREISDLTYHLQDEPFLDSLTVRLNDLLEDVKRHAPHNDTVPLSYTPPSKKIRYLKALSMIPKKQLTSGRFGCHAEASKANFSTDVM